MNAKYVVIDFSRKDAKIDYYLNYDEAEANARAATVFGNGPYFICKIEASLLVNEVTTKELKLTKENN